MGTQTLSAAIYGLMQVPGGEAGIWRLAVVSLLTAMGGSGYVLEKTAADLIAGGRFMAVEDAPDLRQPVFAAIHIRHRTLPLHRKLTQLVARHFRDAR